MFRSHCENFIVVMMVIFLPLEYSLLRLMAICSTHLNPIARVRRVVTFDFSETVYEAGFI